MNIWYLRSKEEEVSRLQNRLLRAEVATQDLKNSLDIALKSRDSSENALKILQNERESFIKSRDWYRDQVNKICFFKYSFSFNELFFIIKLHATQESRNCLQQDLVGLQKVEVELAR